MIGVFKLGSIEALVVDRSFPTVCTVAGARRRRGFRRLGPKWKTSNVIYIGLSILSLKFEGFRQKP
jgi:hypothetical protein